MKEYAALFRRHRDQPASEVFGFFFFRGAAGETWEAPFQRLAALAKREEWGFVRPEHKRPNIHLPVLANYLNNTFLRLQEQDKIRFSQDGRSACFNTGLQTLDEKDIFLLFSRNSASEMDPQYCDWNFSGFFDSYAREMSPFRPLPELATYIEDASDLVLDMSYELDVNIGHLLDDPENQDRLPEPLQKSRTLALAAIEGAANLLRQKVLRNYKTAIPFWYIAERRIQLLLPLCLMQPDHADLALVGDKDKIGRLYRIRTALRMDMAYINARLLTRPDRDWLNP